jgi:sec-independent protein translocase protein TatA
MFGGNLGFPEILVIMVIILLVFGAKRLPEIGSSFGRGIREFKRSLSDATDAVSGPENPPSSTSRQIDSRGSTTPPSGGDPKRLSQ